MEEKLGLGRGNLGVGLDGIFRPRISWPDPRGPHDKELVGADKGPFDCPAVLHGFFSAAGACTIIISTFFSLRSFRDSPEPAFYQPSWRCPVSRMSRPEPSTGPVPRDCRWPAKTGWNPSPYTASGWSPANDKVPKNMRTTTDRTITSFLRILSPFSTNFLRYSSIRIAAAMIKFQGFFYEP